jgi:hypothetical protein
MPHQCNQECFPEVLENAFNIWNWFFTEENEGVIYNFYVVRRNEKGWVRVVCLSQEDAETGVITHLLPEDSEIYTGRLFYESDFNGKQLRVYYDGRVLNCV